MATPTSTCLKSVASRLDILEDYSRFEVDTEPPTDDESDDEEFSFSRQSTDRTEASVEAQCGDLDDVEIETHIQEQIATSSPLHLAVDMDDCVQVMQAMKLVLPSALASAAAIDEEESLPVPKRVFPKRPPGVFFHPSAETATACQATQAAVMPKTPPGFFFRPPPGLSSPTRAVQGLLAK
eukprot:TRINITY_DN663_c0_g2_i1.p1 TRINITY_DN663_c0_g2~~TRINITY_DN663_c0_g2_i1.p1  ORF type:complete len:181 (-),score=48.95 TRINITY_DN663_c0_g2_i1:994-1536(-)